MRAASEKVEFPFQGHTWHVVVWQVYAHRERTHERVAIRGVSVMDDEAGPGLVHVEREGGERFTLGLVELVTFYELVS